VAGIRGSAGLGSTLAFAIHAHVTLSALVAVIAISAIAEILIFADAGLLVALSRLLACPRGRARDGRTTNAFAALALVVLSAGVTVIAGSAVVHVSIVAVAVSLVAHPSGFALRRGRAGLGITNADAIVAAIIGSAFVAVIAILAIG